MDPVQPEPSWPDYASFVKAVARVDREFQWLDLFFSHGLPKHLSGGQLDIIECHGDVIGSSTCSLDDLHLPPKAGSTRIIVLSYDEVWSLDRELLDKVAFALNLPPYFLLQHLEYNGNDCEDFFPPSVRDGGNARNRPAAAASQTMSLELGRTDYFHMSAMIVSPSTSSSGSVGLSFGSWA